MQPPDSPKVTRIILPTPDGPIELPVISLPASAFADLQHGRCTWLVPDVTDGVHDAVSCEAIVSGRECERGHVQVPVVTVPNWVPELS
jgi:hypothetical protein